MVVIAMMGIISCSGSYRRQIRIADSLSVSNPQVAVLYTDSLLMRHSSDMSTAERMKIILLNCKSKNSAYISFQSDSVPKMLVSYYDSHGNDNERMQAYYQLGSVYRDKGDAPLAVECFQKVVNVADTTDTDCDFQTLSIIHGNIADLLYQQMAPQNAMEEEHLSEKYAWKAKDTLSALISYEQNAKYYSDLNLKDSSLFIRFRVYELMKKYGYKENAAIALGPLIEEYLARKNLRVAKKLIDNYMANSGLFDAASEIDNGNFYVTLGQYYTLSGKLDSAYFFLHKAMACNLDKDVMPSVYMAFKNLFELRGEKDSVVKYANLSFITLDSLYASMSTNQLMRMQSTYNYNVQKERAITENNKRRYVTFVSALLVLSLVLVIMSISYTKFKHDINNKREIEHLRSLLKTHIRKNEEYERVQKNLEQLQSEKLILTEESCNVQKLLDEKNRQIEELKNVITKREYETAEKKNIENERILKSDVVAKFKSLANKMYQQPTSSDWQKMYKFVDENIPIINTLKIAVSTTEFQLCILVRLGFSPSEMCILMNMKKAYVSNCRRRLYVRMTDRNGSSKDFDKLIMSLK